MRLDKFLSECGIGTRSVVKNLIKKGMISVNEIKTKDIGMKVDEIKDIIKVNGKKLEYKKERYYLFHKPAGIITATKDSKEKTVLDFLPDWVNKKNLFPVGRLDKDTEGLLLLTTDGKLSHNMLSPKKHVEKTYLVYLKFPIDETDILKLEKGVTILNEYTTKPSKVEKIDTNKIYLTITEGKFHQIKEMAKAINNQVIYLKRISFGKLKLENLEKGQIKEITIKDIL